MYKKVDVTESLILEPEDWTPEEFETLCKVFGCPEGATRIRVALNTVEYFEPDTIQSMNAFDDPSKKRMVSIMLCNKVLCVGDVVVVCCNDGSEHIGKVAAISENEIVLGFLGTPPIAMNTITNWEMYSD